MFRTRRLGVTVIALAIGLAGIGLGGVSGAERGSGLSTVRIGLLGSFFRDMPPALVKASTGPFRTLMEASTGLRGDLVVGGDAFSVAGQLRAGKLHLGVFHGFEFAWAKAKNRDLRPLMIAVNQQRHLSVRVLVAKTSSAKSLADLKGKAVALPSHSKEHCLLFLDRSCEDLGKTPKSFFSKLTMPDCAEDALDDVVDGKVEGAVVDGVALDCYKRRKPGRFAKLKEVEKSAVFPATVVAYYAGKIDTATLQKFKSGMTNAHKSAFGRQLMALWKMTGFEAIPEDYEETLKAIAKTYPPPKQFKISKPAQPK
jgi:ABC-type phosphate/phosphonate transport system substrate-binding protein